VRIDPATGGEATELDLREFLGQAWGMRVNYTIAGYNDMTKVGGAVLLGLMAFVPRNAPIPPEHGVLDVGYGQVESGGWYLVRRPDARYDLRRVAAGFSQPLVAVRTILASPFPGDDAVYFGAMTPTRRLRTTPPGSPGRPSARLSAHRPNCANAVRPSRHAPQGRSSG